MAAIWSVIAPYFTPFIAAIAGEEWRRQYNEIVNLKAQANQKQAAIDALKISAGPVAGSAERLRNSQWNQP